MKTDEYLKRVTNYIFDSRFTRALLINGDWGCGKSYFVKKKLIPEIEKTEVKQDKNENEKEIYYKTLLVSLYGVSSLDAIKEIVYTELLEKYTPGGKDENLHVVLKNATLFGSKIIKGVSNFFSVGEDIDSLGKGVSEYFLSTKKECLVLIFDDLERCQVDTIELMGFLNNLCENNGYRVIIIANEEEVARNENDIVLAIQKQTALWDLYGKLARKNIEGQPKSNKDYLKIMSDFSKCRNELDDTRFRDILDNHVNKLFEKDTLYERTREKLIGLTIQFESNVEEAYEDILNNTVSEGIADYLIKHKSLIVEAFSAANHQNLRTLISVFLALESILKNLQPCISTKLDETCQKYNIDKNEIIETEKHSVISYVISTAIKKVEGKEAYTWKNSRYGSIGNGFLLGKSVFGYAFVDEYWTSLVADINTINTDFSNRITERLELAVQKKQDKEHFELSLFKLEKWYFDDDDVVKKNIKSLKGELKEKKYYSRDFKNIICILLQINNHNFGMNFEMKDSSQSERIYDTNDDLLRLPNSVNTELPQPTYVYDGWNTEKIEEYVKLMLSYFDDEGFEIDKEDLRILSSDPGFVKAYRVYIQPLLDKIEEKELQGLKTSETGFDLFDTQDADFYEFFREHKDSYINKRQFFSLYGFDRFNNVILNATPEEIFNMADAIHTVYNFENVRDFFSGDYDVVDKLWNMLKKDREEDRKIYNPNGSRTREIALRRIEGDLWKYRSALRNPNDETQQSDVH